MRWRRREEAASGQGQRLRAFLGAGLSEASPVGSRSVEDSSFVISGRVTLRVSKRVI